MGNKAKLAMTAEDHKAIGSSAPRELVENPGKTLAETMDDDKLLASIRYEIESTCKIHREIMEGATNK